ncbi:MAG: hypothetical protein M3R64_02790 [Pseudomonadota bacterium]|nr:hypothetical protein [Pseudomonadota bacterium]
MSSDPAVFPIVSFAQAGHSLDRSLARLSPANDRKAGAPGMKAMGTQIIGKFWFRALSDGSYAL